MAEKFRPIMGGLCLVSDNGRVLKTSPRVRFLTPILHPKGYLRVHINKNNTNKAFFIHRLVLEAFRGCCPDGFQTAHLDGNKQNNHINNLAWVSVKENHSHKKLHGTEQTGENNPFSKLKTKQVLRIKELHRCGMRQHDIANKYGVSDTTIYLILKGKTWKHLPTMKRVMEKKS